jgi:hypothetical protein
LGLQKGGFEGKPVILGRDLCRLSILLIGAGTKKRTIVLFRDYKAVSARVTPASKDIYIPSGLKTFVPST